MRLNPLQVHKSLKILVISLFVGSMLASCHNNNDRLSDTNQTFTKINPDGGMDPDVNTATIDFSKYVTKPEKE